MAKKFLKIVKKSSIHWSFQCNGKKSVITRGINYGDETLRIIALILMALGLTVKKVTLSNKCYTR